jgi:predicted nucleic acid-binding protein
MKNFFIDTNVIIDLYQDRKPFADAAAFLFDLSEKRKIKLFISALSYSHVYYVIKKNKTHKEMLAMLHDLEATTETLDVTQKIVSKSIASDFTDFEDALQYQTAISKNNIDAIVTRNGKDYKKSILAVLTPLEALNMIENGD